MVNQKVDESLLNRKFCSFVVSNGNSLERNNFFNKLSKYKIVDSGGSYLNNIGYKIPDKNKWISEYKFNICFENDAHRGYNEHYTTEKLPQAMQSNTIGIYKGNTQIGKEFNTKSFINIREFNSEESAIEYIIELDKNDDKSKAKYFKEIHNFEHKSSLKSLDSLRDPNALVDTPTLTPSLIRDLKICPQGVDKTFDLP
jgi:hypothetical protein